MKSGYLRFPQFRYPLAFSGTGVQRLVVLSLGERVLAKRGKI